MKLLVLKLVLFVPALVLLYGVGRASGALTCWTARATGRLSKSIRLDASRKGLRDVSGGFASTGMGDG